MRRPNGVKKVYGFRFGYEGLVHRIGHEPLELMPESVHRIHESGGSILGSSRGLQDPEQMVDCLKNLAVGILFAIGGDGTLRGAQNIGEVPSLLEMRGSFEPVDTTAWPALDGLPSLAQTIVDAAALPIPVEALQEIITQDEAERLY